VPGHRLERARLAAPARLPRSSTLASHASFSAKKAATLSRIGRGSVATSAASIPHMHMRPRRSTEP
jgi:hypothetical protein